MVEEYLRVIRPKSGLFDIDIKAVLKKGDLLYFLVRRDFVSKYKQTILGPTWAIIQPLLTTVVFTFIFGNIAKLSPDGTPAFYFYFCGTIVWNYFANCLRQTANVFTTNSRLLSKVYFPRLVMPIAATISQIGSFIIQYLLLFIFLFISFAMGNRLAINAFVLMTPLVLIQLGMLGLGLGIIISSLTTKYKDLAMLVSFGVQLWQYASPVVYDITIVPSNLMGLFMLNPVTPALLIFKHAYLGIGYIHWGYYIISWVSTTAVFVIGVLSFNRVEKTFMDTI